MSAPEARTGWRIGAAVALVVAVVATIALVVRLGSRPEDTAGDGAAMPMTVGRAADVVSGGGCRVVEPRTPSGHPPARPGPHSGPPGSPLSRPQRPGATRRGPRTQCHEARTRRASGFTVCLQIEEATTRFELVYEALQASA